MPQLVHQTYWQAIVLIEVNKMSETNRPDKEEKPGFGASGGAKEELEKDPSDPKALKEIQAAIEAQRKQVQEDYKLIKDERRD